MTSASAGIQSSVRNVVVTQPATDVAGTIVVKGTAQDAQGNPLPLEQIEQRLVSPGNLFEVNGRRTLRAPEDGTIAYDAPGSINWTATYTGLNAADIERAVNAQSRILWIGPGLNDITIYEDGEFNGPGMGGCPAGEAPAGPTDPSADTTAPVVSVAAPADGATVSGTVNVTATASDNVGVAGVLFRLDGDALAAEDTAAPFTVSLDTTVLADGSHTLTATARDAAGNVTTSLVSTFVVANAPVEPAPDTLAPSVSLSSPLDGSTVSGTITASASSNDNVGVAGVQFLLNGVAFGAEDTVAPYEAD